MEQGNFIHDSRLGAGSCNWAASMGWVMAASSSSPRGTNNESSLVAGTWVFGAIADLSLWRPASAP